MNSDDDGVKPVHSDGEILSRVYARGRSIRLRRRVVRAVMSVVVISALFAMGAGVARTIHTMERPPAAFNDATSPSPEASVSEPDTFVGGQAPVPSDSAGPIDTPTESPSETPSPVCVNSFDPACGKFYWDPDPGTNAPVSITIRLSSTTVQVGETITATVTVSDPDAPIQCASFEWGDNGTYIGTAIASRGRFGRWETPPKHPSQETFTVSHRYENAGPHQVLYSVNSGTGGCRDVGADPYASGGSASANLIVEGPSPSPTPTDTPTPSPSETVTPSPSPSS